MRFGTVIAAIIISDAILYYQLKALMLIKFGKITMYKNEYNHSINTPARMMQLRHVM